MWHGPGTIVLGPDGMGGNSPIPNVGMHQNTSLFRYGEQTIWSSILFPGASVVANTTNRAFTTPFGQVGQNFGQALSIAETSQKAGSILPAGVAYDVFGIAAQVMHANQAADNGGLRFNVAADNAVAIADLVNIQNNGVLSWDFTQTGVDIAPVTLIGAGGGAFGAVSQNAAGANTGAMNNGNGSVFLYRKHPVALPGQSQFSVVLRFGSRAANIGQNAVAVRIVLLGYYKNVIEIG
jgi:hypothetical protein